MKQAIDYALQPPEEPADSSLRHGPKGGSCKAYGCPMSGAIGVGEHHYCRFHIGAPVQYNDAITKVLRRDSRAIKFLIELEGLCQVDFLDRRETFLQSPFPLREGESLGSYRERVGRWIQKRVRGAVRQAQEREANKFPNEPT